MKQILIFTSLFFFNHSQAKAPCEEHKSHLELVAQCDQVINGKTNPTSRLATKAHIKFSKFINKDKNNELVICLDGTVKYDNHTVIGDGYDNSTFAPHGEDQELKTRATEDKEKIIIQEHLTKDKTYNSFVYDKKNKTLELRELCSPNTRCGNLIGFILQCSTP